MPLSWTEGAKKIAAEEGTYLIKVTINGKPAKKGSMDFAGPAGPETVKKIMALITDAKERMK